MSIYSNDITYNRCNNVYFVVGFFFRLLLLHIVAFSAEIQNLHFQYNLTIATLMHNIQLYPAETRKIIETLLNFQAEIMHNRIYCIIEKIKK